MRFCTNHGMYHKIFKNEKSETFFLFLNTLAHFVPKAMYQNPQVSEVFCLFLYLVVIAQ